MQIICNTCLSYRIYDYELHIEYPNPFIQCTWTPEDMLKLIKNYKIIDYSNINVSYVTNRIFLGIKTSYDYIKCNVDNFITLYYPHTNLYNDDIDCFKETYFNLLKRFDINKIPIFILNYGLDYPRFSNNKNNIINCIKFNFMNAKTIQISSICKNMDVGNPKINKFLHVSHTNPSYFFENARTLEHFENKRILLKMLKELSEINSL